MSFIGGQGVEYWYNGFSRFPSVSSRSKPSSGPRRVTAGSGSDSGFIEVDAQNTGTSEEQVNGEKVEMEMARERKVQKVRSWIAGVGFAMGVVGIWGDGV